GYDNAPDSICPAGWRLPTGPNASQTDYSDMVNLAVSYDNITKKPIIESCGGNCNYYSHVDSGFNSIRTSPLWLVRSGQVYYASRSDTAGIGYYWFSTVYDNTSAYRLYFNSSGVRRNSYDRYSGASIRCLTE
ncbi:hypothetical protein IIY66_02340, partial [Candidatus Saccharibacteria bacterium]|nr:hypothetical protein [Candidatus Saccharibacteria bacterium]